MSGAGTRAILRIARRNIGRSRWRSALVAVLIRLPVAAMVGATAVMIAMTPTFEESATDQMGQADVLPSQPEASARRSCARSFRPAAGWNRSVRRGSPGADRMEASLKVRAMDLDGLARGMVTLIRR